MKGRFTMKKINDLQLWMGLLLLILGTSLSLYSKVNFGMQHTSTKTNFIYEGSTEHCEVSNYYASDGDFYGGASIEVNDELKVDEVKVTLSDGSTITHRLSQVDDHYVINASKVKKEVLPTTLMLLCEGEIVDEVMLSATSKAQYHYSDENQSYRHVYINEAGVFLGNYTLETLDEDISQNVTLEFCHKDSTKSEGYHVFAKKVMSLATFTSQNDLGFVSFNEGAKYDENEDVYVIISWSDTHVEELPLVKGVN